MSERHLAESVAVDVQGEYVHVTLTEGSVTVHFRHQNSYGSKASIRQITEWAYRALDEAKKAQADRPTLLIDGSIAP